MIIKYLIGWAKNSIYLRHDVTLSLYVIIFLRCGVTTVSRYSHVGLPQARQKNRIIERALLTETE